LSHGRPGGYCYTRCAVVTLSSVIGEDGRRLGMTGARAAARETGCVAEPHGIGLPGRLRWPACHG
jgi:hypothetical protein